MAEAAVDGTQTQVIQPDPAIEAEARRGGWRPKEEYTGSAEWVDAKTFVERGKELLPKVQRQAARLEQENVALRTEHEATKAEVAALKQQVKGFTQFQADMDIQARARMRASILEEISAARAAGDVPREMAAVDKLTAPVPPPAPPPVAAPPAAAPPARTQIPQEMTDWAAANPWYQNNRVYQVAMNDIGAELRANGTIHSGMTLTEQLNTAAREVQKRYMAAPSGPARVEGGGRPSGDNPGGARPLQQGTWETLPQHIQRECDDLGKRYDMIGKNKAFPDQNAWRAHYLAEYNRYAPGVGYDYRPPGN